MKKLTEQKNGSVGGIIISFSFQIWKKMSGWYVYLGQSSYGKQTIFFLGLTFCISSMEFFPHGFFMLLNLVDIKYIHQVLLIHEMQ